MFNEMYDVGGAAVSAALMGLKYKELVNFVCTFESVQIKSEIFCSKEVFDNFYRWIKKQNILLVNKQITYNEFRIKLSHYIEKIVSSAIKDKLIVLAREASNCKEEEKLEQIASRLFGLI